MREPRVPARRRLAFIVGLVAVLATAAAGVALGAGCIFDESTYQGGGRRSGAPTATEESTSTPTSTSTGTPRDSGGSSGAPKDADPLGQ